MNREEGGLMHIRRLKFRDDTLEVELNRLISCSE